MSLATELLPTAVQLINDYGSTITLKEPTGDPVYNISTGEVEVTAGTETNYKADISNYTSEEIQGLIQVGDLKILMANEGQSFDIAKDKILFASNEYNIINVQPLYLQDQIMIYELQVRR